MTVDTERFGTLLGGPAAAVLTTYRRDGTAAASPVWFRFADDGFEVDSQLLREAADERRRAHLLARTL